ncbi:transcriptional regulator [Herbaspirillum autotrophicum]|uniref:transcriptional regulator n=1 Tax=Herbaspirillum autotrophicum TaxID=180195 RepID=UPI000AEE83AB|nr:helix-turn-helix domain-containing protein [Herbaspirillum autotrophicum]
MTLIQYLNSLPVAKRDEFAQRCATSFEYLRQIGYGNRQCSPRLAVNLERESRGAITRKILFPDDWQQLWPELAGAGWLFEDAAEVVAKDGAEVPAGDMQLCP